jgi:transcriptional regulator with XRE-family HTH domain
MSFCAFFTTAKSFDFNKLKEFFMFKQNFVNICAKRGVAPTVVLKEIGISHATFSNWTDESVPRQTTIVKIANYFGITPEELLRGPTEKPSAPAEPPQPIDPLTDEFLELIDQLTLKELRELKAQMLAIIRNRK